MAAHPDAEMPRQVDRDPRRPDTAADTCDRDGATAEYSLGRWCMAQYESAEMPRHLIAGQGLRQVVRRAETTRHLAIEVGVVDLANHQHADVRLDDMRQVAKRGERLILAADIDHQH